MKRLIEKLLDTVDDFEKPKSLLNNILDEFGLTVCNVTNLDEMGVDEFSLVPFGDFFIPIFIIETTEHEKICVAIHDIHDLKNTRFSLAFIARENLHHVGYLSVYKNTSDDLNVIEYSLEESRVSTKVKVFHYWGVGPLTIDDFPSKYRYIINRQKYYAGNDYDI